MKTKFKIAIIILVVLAFSAVTAMYMSSHNIAVLDAKGMIGIRESELIITASLLMMIVVVPVFILTLAFAWKYRENGKGKHAPDWEHNYIAEYCWWGVPLVIVAILAILTYRSSHALNPFKPIENGNKPIKIQVIALEWKWLFIYPEQGIATVNYIQFPVNTPLNFEITSDAPMNSFWIPQLGGQIYAMPAMRSKLHLIANEEGTYRGSSANISGKGFAGMKFTAKATSQADFDTWVGEVKKSPKGLDAVEYKQLLIPSEYNPVAYYNLKQQNLFDQSIMKYMMP